jgi:hypothetical protein
MNNNPSVLNLNPIGNIFHPKVYSPVLLFLSVIVLNGLVLFLKGKLELPVYPLAGATVLVLLTLILSSYCPQKITVSKTAVEFDDYVHIKTRSAHSKGFHFQKVHYTVSNLYGVEYHQNPIEKLLNIGHISFRGNARFTADKNPEKIEAPTVFRIYGIPKFSSFKENFL